MSKPISKRTSRRYRYYVCAKAQMLGWDSCPGPSLPANDLEKIVIDQIRELAQEDETINAVVRRAMELLVEDAAIRRRSRVALANRLESTNDEHEAERLTKQLAKLDCRIAKDEKKLIDPDELVGAAESFDPLWDAMTPTEQADLVRDLVAGIDWDSKSEAVHVHFKQSKVEEVAA